MDESACRGLKPREVKCHARCPAGLGALNGEGAAGLRMHDALAPRSSIRRVEIDHSPCVRLCSLALAGICL